MTKYNDNGSRASESTKKFLNDSGLSHVFSLITSFVRNYASPKTHNHDGVYAKSSHTHTTSQVTGLDSALAGKADKSHTHDDRYYTESEANSKFSPIGGSASLNKLSENVTLGNGSAGSIVQNSGTYHQKFEILDDANAGTDTFVFSQSTDSGAKFTKLMSIRDDGNVVANKFTGALSGNAASASSVPWSGVAGKPSSFTPSSHTHDDRYYTESEVDSKLAGKAPSSHTHTIGNITNLQSSLDGKAAVSHGHSAATTSAAGFMSAADKSKLDGVATGANKTIVDSSLSSTSVNPVQNKVVNSALAGKASTSHTHTTAQVTGLDSALAGKAPISHNHNGVYAPASHTHDATNITSGTVSADRLPVTSASKGGTGKTTLVDSANALINSLSEGTSAPTDNDYYVCQFAGGGTTTTTYHRRSMSALWTWIKSKCDAVYQAKGSYAAASHTHNSIKDVGDGRDITFNYSADGAQDATWFAVWNGSELKSMSKQQMKTSLGISSSGVNLGKLMYPVGAVYISYSSTSPASLFGGSWVALTGVFPYFNAGTSRGGSNSHVHDLSSGAAAIDFMMYGSDTRYFLLAKSNSTYRWGGSLQPQGRRYVFANNSGVSDVDFTNGYLTQLIGNTKTSNNMPSYQTLYAWRRTA